MLDRLEFKEQLGGQMVYNGAGRIISPLPFNAYYDIELIRKGTVIHKERVKNGITNDGKNNLLNRFFNGSGTNTAGWYIGLINNSGFSTLSASDVPTSHAGWTEFTTYSRNSDSSVLLRGTWNKGSASGQQITNASAVAYTFTADGTLYGIFLATDPAKSGTTGTLWSTAAFNASLAVQIDDILNVTYTLQLP
jgi:NADH:ubiquinone oxidoreductase subunit